MITYIDLPDGGRLAVEEHGDGPALLLLHAGICDMRMWEPILTDLAADHHVIRFDARGFGRSSDPDGPYTPWEDALEVLDACGVDLAVCVGASAGGAAALDLAIARPDRVAGLVTIGSRPNGSEPDPALVAAWEEIEQRAVAGDLDGANELELRLWVDGCERTDAVDPAVRSFVAEMNAAVWQRAVRLDELGIEVIEEELDPAAADCLDELRCPVLALVGAHDVRGAHEAAASIARDARVGEMRTIAGAAHLPSLERPNEFLGEIRRFLAALRPSD